MKRNPETRRDAGERRLTAAGRGPGLGGAEGGRPRPAPPTEPRPTHGREELWRQALSHGHERSSAGVNAGSCFGASALTLDRPPCAGPGTQTCSLSSGSGCGALCLSGTSARGLRTLGRGTCRQRELCAARARRLILPPLDCAPLPRYPPPPRIHEASPQEAVLRRPVDLCIRAPPADSQLTANGTRPY